MAKLTAKHRNALPDSAFAIPSERKYPVNDRAHAANAKARAAQFASPEVRAKVDAKANKMLHHSIHGGAHDKDGPAHHTADGGHELAHGGQPKSFHAGGHKLGTQHSEHGFRRHPMK